MLLSGDSLVDHDNNNIVHTLPHSDTVCTAISKLNSVFTASIITYETTITARHKSMILSGFLSDCVFRHYLGTLVVLPNPSTHLLRRLLPTSLVII